MISDVASIGVFPLASIDTKNSPGRKPSGLSP